MGIGLTEFGKFNAQNGLQFPTLNQTVAEVLEASAQFPKNMSKVLIEENATEEQIRSLSAQGFLDRYRYLLFSTHGLFIPGNASKTYLALNPSKETNESFDGMLTAGEISTLSLSSDLVFLSACETGLSEEAKSEGLLGLPYAFFLAGAIQVIATLWKVDDDASKLFVTAFFRQLAAVPKTKLASALQKTQIRFLRGDYPGFQHPRFWAGYVIYGG